jgi:hypothetical protein
MSKIFVSHSSTDKAAARRLVARLKEWGYADPFLTSTPSPVSRAAGVGSTEAIPKHPPSHAVIVLCSPHP